MSNYSQITAFTPKDSLSTGNPAKVIKGSDFDAEFAAISTAIISKADDSTVTSELATKTTGPASSTDNTIPRFDGTTGKLLQGSGVYVDDNDNIGLGRPPSAYSSAWKAIDFNNSVNGAPYAAFGQKTTGVCEGFFAWNAYGGSNSGSVGVGYNYRTTGEPASLYAQTAGTHHWFTTPSGTAGNPITFTQAMTLDTSGNLLVGTSTPTIAGASNRVIGEVKGATDALFTVTGGGTSGYLYTSATEVRLASLSAVPLKFFTNNTERMTLDNSGNLLVNASAPDASWGKQVKVDDTDYPALVLTSTAATYGRTYVLGLNDTTSTFSSFDLWDSNNSRFVFKFTPLDASFLFRSGAFGYGVGAGGIGTVVSNAVTINKPSGQINVTGAAIAAGSSRSIRLTNSFIAGIDVVSAGFLFGYGTAGAYTLTTQTGTGFVDLIIRNETGGSLTEQLYIQFTVIKGSTS